MTDSRAFQARGDALYTAGDYPNALEAYRAALALNVSLIDCWHKYIDCLSRTGRLDLAADARRQGGADGGVARAGAQRP